MIISIDPGPKESAYTIFEPYPEWEIWALGKVPNHTLESIIETDTAQIAVVEKISPWGMPGGHTVFDTIRFTGRLEKTIEITGMELHYLTRKEVVVMLCDSIHVGDAQVSAVLKKRFAPGVRNHGKGTKKEPGFFYGFKADIWQAFAVGVAWVDYQRFDNFLKQRQGDTHV